MVEVSCIAWFYSNQNESRVYPNEEIYSNEVSFFFFFLNFPGHQHVLNLLSDIKIKCLKE